MYTLFLSVFIIMYMLNLNGGLETVSIPGNPQYIRLIHENEPKFLVHTSNKITLYNKKGCSWEQESSIHWPIPTSQLRSNKDGSLIVSAYHTQNIAHTMTTISTYDVTNEKFDTIDITKPVHTINFDETKNHLLLISRNGNDQYDTLDVFDLNNKKSINTCTLSSNYLNASPDLSHMCSYDGNKLYIYDVKNTHQTKTFDVGNNLIQTAWHPTNPHQLLALWYYYQSREASLKRLNIDSDNIETLPVPIGLFPSIKYSPDGKYFFILKGFYGGDRGNSSCRGIEQWENTENIKCIHSASDFIHNWNNCWDINNQYIVFGSDGFFSPYAHIMKYKKDQPIQEESSDKKISITYPHQEPKPRSLLGLLACCCTNNQHNYKQVNNEEPS